MLTHHDLKFRCISHTNFRPKKIWLSYTGNQYCLVSLKIWMTSQTVKFMGPTWGPPGSCRPQMSPMFAPMNLAIRVTHGQANTDNCPGHGRSGDHGRWWEKNIYCISLKTCKGYCTSYIMNSLKIHIIYSSKFFWLLRWQWAIKRCLLQPSCCPSWQLGPSHSFWRVLQFYL